MLATSGTAELPDHWASTLLVGSGQGSDEAQLQDKALALPAQTAPVLTWKQAEELV